MGWAVSSCCLCEALETVDPAAVFVADVAAADSAAGEPVYDVAVAGFVGSFAPDIVVPTRECDLISYHRPCRRILKAPSVEEYLHSMNLVAYFARFFVDLSAEFPASYVPPLVSSCLLQL